MYIIRDGKIPDHCADCPCLRQDRDIDGNPAAPVQCQVTLGLRKHTDGKPKWCPLASIPEELEEPISLILQKYEYAVKQQWVHDPVAWAIWRTCKEIWGME